MFSDQIPVTIGAAIEVPLSIAAWLYGYSDMTFTPGAWMFTHFPWLLKRAHFRCLSYAPTVSAAFDPAGLVLQASLRELPAAATIRQSRYCISVNTLSNADDHGPPMDKFMIVGCWTVAAIKPSAAIIYEYWPWPSPLSTCMETIRARLFTPNVRLAIRPATCVPWPPFPSAYEGPRRARF